MNDRTEQVIAAIQAAADDGVLIAPAMFTAFHPRACVSAAFRIAKARGIIVEDYMGGTGVPVYRKGGAR
ncbi:MAG: hypothetical protein IH988_05295 [Planctomycetes bacterium]|nr:hypothetical protein [Planctomycetota bacterium]